MVYLETKKRYHPILAKFQQKLKLLESVIKTLSGKILIFKKILRNMGYMMNPALNSGANRQSGVFY